MLQVLQANKEKRPFKLSGKMLLTITIVLYLLISVVIQLDILFFLEIPAGLEAVLQRYFPPKFEEVADMSNIKSAIWETLVIASAASVTGSIIALLMVLLSINEWKVNIFAIVSKAFSSITRCIPSYIMGYILVYILWQGSFIAYLAITLGTTGFLIRTFGEVMKNNGKASIEALKATGATNWQIITRAIIPGALPLLFSWSLYSFEGNVRSSTIVGLIAQMGLGGLFVQARDMPEMVYADKWNYLMAVIITISLLVIFINVVVTRVRGRLLKWN